jgi:hypothetical protein
MSTDEEIRETFAQDILDKEKIVKSRFGILPFLEPDSYQVEGFWMGILDEDDYELLQNIVNNDGEADGD